MDHSKLILALAQYPEINAKNNNIVHLEVKVIHETRQQSILRMLRVFSINPRGRATWPFSLE